MTGQFRGKRLFGGRLFAGRLFGPEPRRSPAGGAGRNRLQLPRRRDRDDDVLLFVLRTPF